MKIVRTCVVVAEEPSTGCQADKGEDLNAKFKQEGQKYAAAGTWSTEAWTWTSAEMRFTLTLSLVTTRTAGTAAAAPDKARISSPTCTSEGFDCENVLVLQPLEVCLVLRR